MYIRLKRYSAWLKILAFVLIAAVSVIVMLILLSLQTDLNGWNSSVFASCYTDSWAFRDDVSSQQNAISTIISYKNESNILTSSFVSQSDINNVIQSMFEEARSDIVQSMLNNGADPSALTEQMLWDQFHVDYKSEIENAKNILIQNQLSSFRNAVNHLKNNQNIEYFINADGTIYANTDKGFAALAADRLSYNNNNTEYKIDGTVLSQYAFAFNPSYISAQTQSFNEAQKNANRDIIAGVICLAIFLMSFCYLIFAAGKKANASSSITLIFPDRLYNEFTLGLLLIALFSIAACGVAIYKKLLNQYFMLALLAITVCLSVGLILMLARHIKNRTLLKHTLLYSILAFIGRPVKKIFDAGSPMAKTVVIVVVLGLLTMIPLAGIVTIPLAVVFAYKQVRKYQMIRDGVAAVKDGHYTNKIDVVGTGEWAKLAENINEISAGLGGEVVRRMKSERLKTELIVNVSHDIRTPLTSIITYADLLKKENIQNDAAQKYIDVIATKTGRLKVLIDDLFEASKAASGNVPVNFQEVDVNALITQGLGELDEKIKASSLEFKVNLLENPIIVWADGRLLWRSLENLFSNVFKYSLPNSRVYIDIYEDEKNAYIEMKNISAAELNIPADEITERFKRGDLSRNSEGSGLGLDIAKSLMICQNGELCINIDGDLFKAKLRIEKPVKKT